MEAQKFEKKQGGGGGGTGAGVDHVAPPHLGLTNDQRGSGDGVQAQVHPEGEEDEGLPRSRGGHVGVGGAREVGGQHELRGEEDEGPVYGADGDLDGHGGEGEEALGAVQRWGQTYRTGAHLGTA